MRFTLLNGKTNSVKKKTDTIGDRSSLSESELSISCYGLIGCVYLDNGYLVAIKDRKPIVSIHGSVVYNIQDVVIIPLTCDEAKKCIKAEKTRVQQHTGDSSSANSSDDEKDPDIEQLEIFERPVAGDNIDTSSIIENVLLKKPNTTPHRYVSLKSLTDKSGTAKKYNGKTLVPKFLKFLKSMFQSKSFYFSYELDLTNSIAYADPSRPPRKCFWFNKHMSKAFQNSPLSIRIVQGFVGVTHVPVERRDHEDNMSDEDDEEQVSVILLSRRSVKRAGVRYLRRGIDDNGYCANWVETEQLLHYSNNNICSYTQVRGSIPIFFAQSPYSLKPPPKVTRSIDETFIPFNRHVSSLKEHYGGVLAISLIEKPPSIEAEAGTTYEQLANENGIDFEWFDFHQECKGMQFDRVMSLFDNPDSKVDEKLQQFGWTDVKTGKYQSGVFRINCIDCLDRTNVVETYCAKRVLEKQIASLNLKLNTTKERKKYERELNNLWADNGDAISLQYSSTSALKGDFTRTNKRNYRGVLTDAFLSLSRYFYGMVSDFFTQIVLDYTLGYVGEEVFDEFEEYLQSSDPANNKEALRQSAIDITSEIVLASDDEILYGGWWLLTPKDANSNIRRAHLVDRIFLVTNFAIYICEFDIKKEKVLCFNRIPSEQILKIQTGHFFCDSISRASRDPNKNIGFILSYDNNSEVLKSTSKGKMNSKKINKQQETIQKTAEGSEEAVIALKVPWLQANEYEEIYQAITRTCPQAEVSKKDIVTLEEARNDTTLWNILNYQLRQAVWG